MQINLQGKNMDVTVAVEDYVIKRITNLGKLLTNIEEKGGEVIVYFNVAKNTNHHKSGAEVFGADCSITINGDKFYSSSDKPDLYEAIDDVKENLFREIQNFKDKKQTLFHRGARKIKNMLKGLGNFNK